MTNINEEIKFGVDSGDDEKIAVSNQQQVLSSMFTNAASATGQLSLTFMGARHLRFPDKEHKMTLLQGVRLYPKAIFWAVAIAMCCVMEGYDIALIGNFYAFPPFNRKYGELQLDGSYQVPARWQAGISNGAQCGQIVGLLRESFRHLKKFRNTH